MGFMDMFTGGKDGQLKRHSKRLSNLNAQVEDRESSAYWLAEDGSEQAILGLLGRFTVSYEHQMKDMKEKDLVYGLLKDMGAEVSGPIKTWARTATQFARPLKLVDHFEGGESVVTLLLEMLAAENDPFKPEKKRQILIRLAEYADPRIRDGIQDALRDFDEGIRYAAVEALLAQDHDSVQADLAATRSASPSSTRR